MTAAIVVNAKDITDVRSLDLTDGPNLVFSGKDEAYKVFVPVTAEVREAIIALVRSWDYDEISAAHDEACPACRGEGGERVAVVLEAEEANERQLTRCDKVALVGLDGPVGCRLVPGHAGPHVPQHGLKPVQSQCPGCNDEMHTRVGLHG